MAAAPPERSGAGGRRFEALDSWRGLCACAVALLHASLVFNMSYAAEKLFYPFYLCVDFFFVLSGFVIAHSYAERLRSGFGLLPYLVLRAGRLYPLHLAVLAVLVASYAIPAFILGSDAAPTFGYRREADALLPHALLLQSVIGDAGNWNVPSWSVSAELVAYVLFALVWTTVRGPTWPIVAALAAACFIALLLFSPTHQSATLGLGVVRCLGGFACGVLAHQLFTRIPVPARLPRGSATAAELLLVAAAFAFMQTARGGPWSLAAPLVFSAIVLVFAFEAGGVSRLLKTPAFVALGSMSYSIYLVHEPLFELMLRISAALEDRFGLTLSIAELGVTGRPLLGTSTLAGNAVALGFLAVTLAVAWTTYRLVEQPGRAAARRLALALSPAARTPASGAPSMARRLQTAETLRSGGP